MRAVRAQNAAALTAGAWLHAGAGADAARLTRMLRMVQTSSPAFVGLLSLDDARAWMDAHGAASLEALKRAARSFYAQAAKLGYAEGGAMRGFACDETRLVLEAPQGGFALAGQLARMGLDVEMSDERRIVCILSLMDGESRLRRLLAALEVIGPQTAQTAGRWRRLRASCPSARPRWARRLLRPTRRLLSGRPWAE